MPRVLLFDLGNTLVRYYQPSAFKPILDECIGQAARCLHAAFRRGERNGAGEIAERTAAEDHESPDHRVRPLEDRLAAIFGIQRTEVPGLIEELCGHFMKPIFAIAMRYDDTLPTLARLRRAGHRICIVSNTPWGSPSGLWHRELLRHGITNHIHAAFFCRDCGWRKPSPHIFHHVLSRMGVEAGDTLFIGDDPRWDVAGPAAVGIRSVLIARSGVSADPGVPVVESLENLMDRPGLL
ncbi:MAG TPA: HAD family hydrolase [Candidatus Kapabacteria bacterium]|nr:HAD family hydrolase [Candidatus Kapabacteria bacterium]